MTKIIEDGVTVYYSEIPMWVWYTAILILGIVIGKTF